MPGTWSASFCISSIASPELTPGAGCPWNSNEGTPWNRDRLLGVVAQPVRAKEEKGAISPVDERTYHWPRLCGSERYGASPWTYTRLTRPWSMKSLT